MRSLKWSTVALVILGGSAACRSEPASGPEKRARQPQCTIEAWARYLTGVNARDCSEDGLLSPASQQACVAESLDSDASFYVYNRRTDVESYVVVGHVLSARGDLHEMIHDSSVFSTKAGDRVFLRNCSNIIPTNLPIDGVVFDCVDPGPWVCACGVCDTKE